MRASTVRTGGGHEVRAHAGAVAVAHRVLQANGLVAADVDPIVLAITAVPRIAAHTGLGGSCETTSRAGSCPWAGSGATAWATVRRPCPRFESFPSRWNGRSLRAGGSE